MADAAPFLPSDPAPSIQEEGPVSAPYAPCFSCKALTLHEKLTPNVLDFDILLQYFRFETEFHSPRKYCPGCHSSLTKIKETYRAMVKLRSELDSSVLMFKMKACLQVRGSEWPITVLDKTESTPFNEEAQEALLSYYMEPSSSSASEYEDSSPLGLSSCSGSSSTCPGPTSSSDSILSSQNHNNSGCEDINREDIELSDVKLFTTPSCEPEPEIEQEEDQSSASFGSDSSEKCAHLRIPVACPYCEITLESISKFDKHFSKHHQGQLLQCEKCEKTFHKIWTLRVHDVAVHQHGKGRSARY